MALTPADRMSAHTPTRNRARHFWPLLGGVLLLAAPAAFFTGPAHASDDVEPQPTPAASQVLTIPSTAPEPLDRPQVIVTPAAQVLADADAAPVPSPVAPSDDLAPIERPDCAPGLIAVEDGSCVPPSFYDEPTPAPFGLAPCADEDGPGPCYWDATTRGNGVGASFVIDAQGVTYLAQP